MVRMARVDRRRRKDWPSASDNSEVTWRLGKNRRRVLLLAWLTLLPLNTPLPVMSQRRDMVRGTSGCRKPGLWRRGDGTSRMKAGGHGQSREPVDGQGSALDPPGALPPGPPAK